MEGLMMAFSPGLIQVKQARVFSVVNELRRHEYSMNLQPGCQADKQALYQRESRRYVIWVTIMEISVAQLTPLLLCHLFTCKVCNSTFTPEQHLEILFTFPGIKPGLNF